MALANIVNTDEDLLICDFAETYGIYDYRSLPLNTVATLFVGLRANSRTKMKLSGMEYEPKEFLLSMIADRLSLLVWMNTKDALRGENMPTLILSGNKEDKEEIVGFYSGTDFEKERERILRGER